MKFLHEDWLIFKFNINKQGKSKKNEKDKSLNATYFSIK